MLELFRKLVRAGVSPNMSTRERDEIKVLNSFSIHSVLFMLVFMALFAWLLPAYTFLFVIVLLGSVFSYCTVVWLNYLKKHLVANYVLAFMQTLMVVFCTSCIGLDSDYQFMLFPVYFALGMLNRDNLQEKLVIIFISMLMACGPMLYLYVLDVSYYDLSPKEVSWAKFLAFSGTIAHTIIAIVINYANQRSRSIYDKDKLKVLGTQASMFRAVSENIIGGMFRSTPDSGLIYANKDFLRIFGFDSMEEALTFDPVSVYAYPDERKQMLKNLQRQGFIEQQRILFKRKDGNVFWGSLTVTLTLEGGSTYIDGTIVDITQAIEEEQMMIERDEQLLEAQRLARLGSWQINHSTREVQWSDEMFSIFDRDQDIGAPGIQEFLGRFEDLQPNEALSNVYDMARQSSGPHSYETWITTEEGLRKYIRSIFYFDTGPDGLSKSWGTVQDVTDQKLMEDRLIETKEFYERILDRAPIEMAILDVDFRYIFVNKQAIKDDAVRRWIIGKTDHQYCEFRGLEQAFADRRRSRYAEAAESGRAIFWEEEMTDRAGVKNYIMRSTVPLLREDRSIANYVAFGFNVSRMREAQIVLQHRNEELQKLNAELDRFVYSISHDLRAPIASVLGLINIGEDAETAEEVKEIFNMQRDALERLDSYIREVIDYSRNQRLGVTPESVSIFELCESIVSGLRFLPSLERIDLQLDVPQGLTVMTDSLRLKVALNNLVSNAIRYSDIDKPDPFVRIHAHGHHNGVVIEVEDNGIGIRKEYLEKVWDMFFRGTSKSGGSGLGLYILKEMIQKVGGTVELESEQGVGSTFTMTIPNYEEKTKTNGRSKDSSLLQG